MQLKLSASRVRLAHVESTLTGRVMLELDIFTGISEHTQAEGERETERYVCVGGWGGDREKCNMLTKKQKYQIWHLNGGTVHKHF